IHVLDAIGSFCEPPGLVQDRVEWNLPVPAEAHEWAAAQWPDDGAPVLMISPCSSHQRRNWYPDRYAALADHAASRGWRVVLCGGRSELERSTTDAILAAMRSPALDLVGKDTLKQLPALLERADLLVTPDSGPMHIANAMGTKVLGLHAASNPARSGPYSDRRYCVDRYDDAARKYLGKPAAELKWGTKIEHEGVMELVAVDDAIAAFERYRADHGRRSGSRGVTASSNQASPPRLPAAAVLALFVVSGFAGLVYQSLWSHYLGLVLGHAAYAQSLVLAIFMGGMALGAWGAARLGLRWRRLVMAYAVAEAVIGILGLVFHPVFLGYTGLSERLLGVLGDGLLAQVYPWLSAALLILPSCILLGATFPLLSAGWIRARQGQDARVLGGLYFANSLGAAAGALAATFLLLPRLGMPGALVVAGVANLLVAAAAAWLARG